MKAPLYVILLMLVGVFLATPATAQDEAAAEDTLSAQDAVQASDEAAQTTEEAAQAAEEAAEATDEAAQATDEAAQATEDAAQTTEEAVEMTEDAVQTTEEAVEMTEDAAAQPTQASITVEWIVNEAPDESPVALKGRLTESLGDNEYLFEDETGTVQVEIDGDLLSPDQFQAGVEVEIIGAVDKDQEEGVEIEVERLNVV